MFLVGLILGIFTIISFIFSIYAFSDDNKVGGVVSSILCVILLVGTIVCISIGVRSESFKRWTKDLESNYNGGLQRVIQVVDKDGKVIKEYRGKMDIQETSGEKIVFIMDGRKYIIYNNSIFNTIFVEELDEE